MSSYGCVYNVWEMCVYMKKFYVLFLLVLAAVSQAKEYNVLFIAVDDLRPELGCYGHSQVKSPNIDALASRGTVFLNAFCQQAVCNPSRASLMTGLRPDTLKVYDLETNFRKHLPEVVTVAEHFRNNGYVTERVGKIFHTAHGNSDDPKSWSVYDKYKLAPRYSSEGTKLLGRAQAEGIKQGLTPAEARMKSKGLPYESANVEDAELTDGSIADEGIKLLNKFKDKKFFLALGFLNPHLPFVAPKKYWDMYDPAQIKVPRNNKPPVNSPLFARTNWTELRQYSGMPEQGNLSHEQSINMIHGYYAAVSYVDACVGKVLAELHRLGLSDNTVVVLWGDHGWQLGEHGFWCKHTNYEVATRAPLIFSVPGQRSKGFKNTSLVEFVDVFPTLADVCGLEIPEKLEGLSLKPIINSPDLAWKNAVFHLYPRGSRMGRTIRTNRYRLVEWTSKKDPVEIELYDLHTDPDENINIAGNPENASLVEELTRRLHDGWRKALPPSAE
jgi:iduronate 2-sulfatase